MGMREILFRAKINKTESEWVEGFYVHIPCGRFMCDEHLIQTIDADGRIGQLYNVYESTMGQFTGLTDKNGKKIFEGDILKVKTMWHAEFHEDNNGFFSAPIKKETYWSVEYKNFCGKMGFMVYGIDRRWHTNLTWNKLYNSEAVVVGNIYDNPELMKKKEGDKNDLRKMHT